MTIFQKYLWLSILCLAFIGLQFIVDAGSRVLVSRVEAFAFVLIALFVYFVLPEKRTR